MRVLERHSGGWFEDLSEAPFNKIRRFLPDSCTGTAVAIIFLMISPMFLAIAALVIPFVLAVLLGLAAMFVLPAGVLAISVLLVLRESRHKQANPSNKHTDKSEITSQEDRGIFVPSVRMIHTALVQLSDALRLSDIVMPWCKLLNPEMRLRVSVEVAMRTSNDDLPTLCSSKRMPETIVGNSVCLPIQSEQPKELLLLHKPDPMSLSAPAIAKGTTEQLHSSPKVPKCLPPRGPSGLGGSHASGFLSERQLLENRSSVKGVHKFHEWLEASRRASPPVVEPVVPTARLCRKSTAGSLSLSPSLPDLINLRHEDSDQESESSRPMSFSECARSSAVPRASAFSHRRFRSLDRVVGTDSASNSASATWSDSERALRRRRLEMKGDRDPGFALRQAVYARNNQQWRLKHLLRRNANPNTCNHLGSAPLHIAAWHGKGLDALKLVEYGAALNTQDEVGMFEQSPPQQINKTDGNASCQPPALLGMYGRIAGIFQVDERTYGLQVCPCMYEECNMKIFRLHLCVTGIA